MDPREQVTSAATVAIPTAGPPSSSTHIPDEGRFVPGTILAGRYRIIGLLGQGGMGEVYRATDLTLGQSVALKFLPEAAGLSQALLERFHGEVRVARQVSHPNVCRVYDIGEADGLPFISMEYVDGEDLATLLLRIGRLPSERAVEIARRICAGLAAAHAKGVIHRDLKPQNIMMNRRGEIMIMDFGLAAVAGQLTGSEARSGTPAYMAPEQLKGTEVTARSDIYALGLVLFELFTGKRPFDADSIQQLIRLQESSHLPVMTALAGDIDPAVEKVIRRCLDPDPAKRPATPLAVASALPGGDPLAAALAAGETPSPDLVASAGKTEGLPLRQSIPYLAVAVLCILASPILKQQKVAFFRAPSDFPPDVLQQKARDISAAFGYTRKPADRILWIDNRLDLLTELNKRPAPREWQRWLASEAPFTAVYREAAEPLIANPRGNVDSTNPPPISPGMVTVEMDGQGRLRGFRANPYPGTAAGTQTVSPEAVFRAAQLDMAQFTEVAPQTTPSNIFDQFRAWKGKHPGIPDTDLTVEIGTWKGSVTSVKFLWPWTPKDSSTAAPVAALPAAIQDFLEPSILICGLVFALVLARRNWKQQRADRRGAWRVASTIFLLNLSIWAGTAHILANNSVLGFLANAVAGSLLAAFVFFLLYLALEPALRARWPHSIVTWNRVLSGRWKDAQVGSHVLIGATVGTLVWAIDEVRLVLTIPVHGLDTGEGLGTLLGTRHWLAMFSVRGINAIESGLVVFFVFFGLRVLLRKNWLAALVAAVIFSLIQPDLANSSNWHMELIAGIVIFGILFFVLLRLGLVATISAMFFVNVIDSVSLGTDLSTWYAPTGIATLAVLLGLIAWAFRQSLGDQQLAVE
jgi:serine/threonine-protein kinase